MGKVVKRSADAMSVLDDVFSGDFLMTKFDGQGKEVKEGDGGEQKRRKVTGSGCGSEL